jgi:16S rRNA (adenine1518-N6/adenine1519-N6)-dimethyltransferase
MYLTLLHVILAYILKLDSIGTKQMHQPRKRFGQNFLQDETVVDHIVSAIHPTENDRLVEIGPGLGALTTHLLPLVKKMDVIELDRDIVPKLASTCKDLGELIIHQADALSFDFASLGSLKLRVVGNLPYNISTPLLFHLIDQMDCIQDMHFMLQKEVVDRICAKVGTKDYGRLAIMIQYHCFVEKLFEVSPDAFYPKPKVTSAVVCLIPKKEKTSCDVKQLSQLVKQSFSQRRKTLKNNLKEFVSVEQLEALSIDPGARPEQITIEQYVALARITQSSSFRGLTAESRI